MSKGNFVQILALGSVSCHTITEPLGLLIIELRNDMLRAKINGLGKSDK